MKQPLFSFNRGKVSNLSLARVDQKRVSLSAETMTNWMPRTMGPMSLRPGLKYIHSTKSNAAARYLKFIFSATDTALIELTEEVMRVAVNDSLVTRLSVSSAVTNGNFDSNVTNWTDADDSGATSDWETGGYMYLLGDGVNFAKRYQTVTVAAPDQGIEHALRIVITRGPVILRVGSTVGGDDYIAETYLDIGTHSLAFTPYGNFTIYFKSSLTRKVLINSCNVESSGIMEIPTDFRNTVGYSFGTVRYAQSGDILFLAWDDGFQQTKIERRGSGSWSYVYYETEDGPFRVENTTPVTLTPSAFYGNITLTASAPLFSLSNFGGLYKLTSTGQTVARTISTANYFTNAIRVTGVDAARDITISIFDNATRYAVTNAVNNGVGLIRLTVTGHNGTTGQVWSVDHVTGTTEANGTWTITNIDPNTIDLQGSTFVNAYVSGGYAGRWVATKTLQLSYESEYGPWTDVSGKTWVGNSGSLGSGASETYNDTLNNQIVWYRIGVKTSNFGVFSTAVLLSVNTGSITGIVRIAGTYTSSTVVGAEVLSDLGGTTATDVWSEGQWSARRGFPTAVSLHEGRLWWCGKDKINASVSDSYYSFDPDYEGDAGPISRSIGSGPVDQISWMASLQRLLIGGECAEYSCRASSLDEPMTPTNFMIRPSSTQGSAHVDFCQLDQGGVFVQRNGIKVYELSFDGNSYDYKANDLMALIPEMGSPGIVRIDIQRQPDTRIHCVRSDGTVALGVFDKTEEVMAWIDIETDGDIEDVVVLPGTNGSTEDQVYYVVKRTINGSTVRYLEKWALETECRGGTLNKQADSFVTYTGAATTTITAAHLANEQVVVWADGADVGTNSDYTQIYTLNGSGQATLSSAVTNYVVGLPYTAQWKSSKLAAQADSIADAFTDKHLNHVGLSLAYVHPKGLRFGPDFTNLDNMPEVESGISINQNTIRTTYNEQEIEFPGIWETDARLCLQAQAPRPVTVLAAIPVMKVAR